MSNTGEHSHNVPLTDVQRTIVVVAHFLAFVVGAWNLWAFLRRVDTLRNRIWSPFALLLGLVWLQVGSALEIGNHYYEGNWELAGFPTDLVNGTFYFFNFGAQYLNALGLRKIGLAFLRRPAWERGRLLGVLDLIAMIFDALMIVGVAATAPVYVALGRDGAIGVISAFGAGAGVGTLFRLWRNLGPNGATLWGGVLFLALALAGVAVTAVYRETGIEWLHVLIGGSFVASIVPFTVAILYSQDREEPVAEVRDVKGALADGRDEVGDEERGENCVAADGFAAEDGAMVLAIEG